MRPRSVLILGLVVLMAGAVIVGRLGSDMPAVRIAVAGVILAAFVAIFVLSPAAREQAGARFPPVAWLGRGLLDLRGRVVLVALAMIVGGFALAEAFEDVFGPDADLARFVEEHYDAAGPGVYVSRQGPLQTARELERSYPADDQHYVPIGVLLRYEDHVVAVLPDGRGGSRLRVVDDEAGYQAFHRYVGTAWGPAYDGDLEVAASAAAVPSEADRRDVIALLDEAERAQDVCYGWRVEIRSGRREGLTEGNPRREGRDHCTRYLVLNGWIDPLAGRFARRGDPGDWDFSFRWRGADLVDEADLDAVSVTANELLEGSTTEPSGSGERAGKGLLDHIGSLPLLAAERGVAPPVPVRRATAVPPGARPEPAERSDADRRAEESWVAIPAAILRVTAGFVLVMLLVLLPVAAIRRLVRRLRG